MLEQIKFRNYKAFKEEETLEVKPITILIGKNSSGKSSLCKLFPLLENSMSGKIDTTFLLKNKEISIGTRYQDLFHNGILSDLMLGVKYENGIEVSATFIMQEGALLIYRYNVTNGEDKKREEHYETEKESRLENFHGLINLRLFKEINLDEELVRFNVDYIGPIRNTPPRTINFEGYNKYESVGYNGENTYTILLNSYLQGNALFKNISRWFEENLEGQKLEIREIGTGSGVYSLFVCRKGALVNIADVGQGIGQILPIVVQSFMEDTIDLAIIEQPALHLHPAVHATISYLLGQSSKKNRRKYIIETHSENILLGFRKMIVDPDIDFSPDDIVIYFVDSDDESAFLSRINIDENGELSTWPTGVFSESFDLMAEIMKNRK